MGSGKAIPSVFGFTIVERSKNGRKKQNALK